MSSSNPYADILDRGQTVNADAGGNPYLDLLDEDKRRADAAMRGAVSQALGVNPQAEAASRRVAGYLGVPPAAAQAMPQEMEQAAKVKQLEDATRSAPALRRRYTDADFARIASDDAAPLAAVESAVAAAARYVMGADNGGLPQDLVAGVYKASAGAAGTFRAAFELLGTPTRALGLGDPFAPVSGFFGRLGQDATANANAISAPREGIIGGGVQAGVQSAAQNLTFLLAGRPDLALAGMVATSGGQSYQQARERGVPVGTAVPFAASQAAIEYATERIPVGRLFGDLQAGRSLFSTLWRQAAAEVPGEQVATVLQDLNEWAVLNPEKPFSAYLAERPAAAAQTLIATLVGTGGNVAVMSGVQRVADSFQGRDRQAEFADAQAEMIRRAKDAAAATALRDRAPEDFESFVAEVTRDGPLDVLYADADALMQSGIADQLVQASPAIAQQLQTAAATGGAVEIPMAELVGRLDQAGLADQLVDVLKTDPNGFSRAEAQAWQTERAALFQQEMEQATQEQEARDAVAASRDTVREQILGQIQATGRQTADVAAAYADSMAAWYDTQAARLGITPQQLWQQHPVRIEAEGIAGDALQQSIDLLASKWQSAQVGDTTIEVVSRDGYAEVQMLRTPSEKRGQGSARAAMDSLVKDADAQGVTLFLTAEAMDKSTSKAKLEAFYRSLGFVANKGRNKDFRARAGMVRQPKGGGQNAVNQGARGAYFPDANRIVLGAQADLSTFLHESGHFYLETLSRIVAAGNAPAEMQADLQALFDWIGWKGDAAGFLETPLDQRREQHETFARGFERYLFEGNAPSLDLQGLFQRFRSWMMQVYRSMARLNVTLSDEVRAVFDRMLASQDAIGEMQALRGMAPAFTAEQAEGLGIDFRGYHEADNEASQQALQDLQAKGLRDMQWLANARGRELKRLQKLAAGLRRDIRNEVRAEVMSQPVYRAWQFLTGKDSAALPDTPSQAQEAYAGALATWQADRAAFESEAKAAERGRLWDQSPESQAAYENGRAKGMAKGQFLARNRKLIDANVAVQLAQWEQENRKPQRPPAEAAEQVGPLEFGAGKLDTDALRTAYGTGADAVWRKLSALRMTSDTRGLAPDVVAEAFGFDSGDAMVQALATATPPAQVVEALTDQRMLERHGEIASAEDLERAADAAVHNEARARFVAAELNALEKAAGAPRTLADAARQFAASMVGRTRVRDLRPGRYTVAEGKAARQAMQAIKKGDTAAAATAKRNQLVNNHAARAALNAQDEAQSIVRYLKRFERRTNALDADYADQIDKLLERFELKTVSNRKLDSRAALASWVQAQNDAGIEPDIPPELLDETRTRNWRDLSVDEIRGLRDTVRQIEHLGRMKNRLLTAREQKQFEAVRAEIIASIEANGRGRKADTRTPNTVLGQALLRLREFGAAHIKAATWARIMDGGKDGGPVWEYLIRGANDAGNREVSMRASATADIAALVAPVLKERDPHGIKGRHFPSIGRSLNREARLAIALNWGNESNRQRLLGGEGWTAAQVQPVLQSLTAAEWRFVQDAWDLIESYRPMIAAKERRVYGKEPAWIERAPFVVQTSDGKTMTMAGGYYPVKYDPRASERAEAHHEAEDAKRQMQGAYSSATTRRSFTKARTEEVRGRPLLYTLDGLYNGVQEVIHDLAWHEWLIDTNRLLRSDGIATAIRSTYGPEVHQQFKQWTLDVAAGDRPAQEAGERAAAWVRQGVSVAGLGFNVMSAAIQPLGITQSMARLGTRWVGRGVAQFIGAPRETYRTVAAKSDFMRERARTRFRELAEVRNQVRGQSRVRGAIDAGAYAMMLRAQQLVDLPTWLGGYEKAIADGNSEDRAIALADQAVIDAQGSGTVKDLSSIERGGPLAKLFTVFYSFFNTTLNLAVVNGMTETSRARQVANYTLLFVAPVVLTHVLREALTPGGGDDDTEELARKLLGEQLSFMFGLFVGVREFTGAAQALTGTSEFPTDYRGPGGLRLLTDATRAAQQIQQGEADEPLRKSLVNVAGSLLRLPAAQINRSVTGAQALADGETSNPAALVFGFDRE